MPHESENIEQAALADLHAAATPELRSRLSLRSDLKNGVLASIAGKLPASAIVINRVLGLGLAEPATPQQVRDIVADYREAGVARYFIQKHPDAGPPEMAAWMREAGLEKARGWQKFKRGPDEASVVETDLSIRRITAEQGATFARIVCDAFDLGDAAIPWLARLAGRERWHLFMSFYGDEPAGAGALFLDSGCAWTDFGATSPKFRRRGSQAALLAARINQAVEHGCQALYTCTGEDVPGDPQHSYKNILSAGFREAYIKENYAPPRGS